MQQYKESAEEKPRPEILPEGVHMFEYSDYDSAKKAINLVTESGEKLVNFKRSSVSLEDVFLKITEGQ